MENIYRLYEDGNYMATMDTVLLYLRHEDSEDPDSVDYGDRVQVRQILGNIHFSYGNYLKANEYYLGAVRLPHRAGPDTLIQIYSNLAVTYCCLGDSSEARRWTDSVRLIKGAPAQVQHFNDLGVRAFYEKTFGSREKALRLNREAADYVLSSGMDSVWLVSPVSEIIELYEHTDSVEQALEVLEKYEEKLGSYNKPAVSIVFEKVYAGIYHKRGDEKRALRHQERYLQLKDSLLNLERLLLMGEKYDSEVKDASERKIEKMQITISAQKATLGIIIICVVIGLLLWLFLSMRKRQRLMSRALYRHTRKIEELEQTVEETVTPAEVCRKEEDRSEEERNARLLREIGRVMRENRDSLDPDFNVAKLAKLAGSNSKYVSACINEHYGMNFRSFVNQYRIREACRRIEDRENWGNITIRGIAESVGFRSTSNFVVNFRHQTGLSPSEYRRRALEGGAPGEKSQRGDDDTADTPEE